jgi:hypothetical protein
MIESEDYDQGVVRKVCTPEESSPDEETARRLLALIENPEHLDDSGFRLLDSEGHHIEADNILAEFVRSTGHSIVADAYEKVSLYFHYS